METKTWLLPVKKRPVGEIRIWFTSLGLALGLLMIFGLLGIIVYKGLETFWPKTLYQVELKAQEGQKTEPFYAALVKEQERRDYSAAQGDIPFKKVEEYQFFTGSKEVYGQSYRYVDTSAIAHLSEPKTLLVLERLEGGNALVEPLELKLSGGRVLSASSPEFFSSLEEQEALGRQARQKLSALEKGPLGSVNKELGDVRREIKLLELSYDFSSEGEAQERENPLVQEKNPLEKKQALESQVKSLLQEYETYTEEITRLRGQEGKSVLVYQLASGQRKEIAADKIVHAYAPNALGFWGKLGVFCQRFWSFMSEEPREANTEGGIFPAIFGTFVMTVLMSILVTPIGVIAAIYLKEYARQGTLVRIVRICVNNLAGVPSIVFGVFGLGFFVYFVGGTLDEIFFWKKLTLDNTPTFGTSGILWASLTLALMTLPVVIVATEEALSSVPGGLREAALACGASKWQMIQRILLPSALPGVLTGLILAMARGAGEVAPLMVTGVVKLAPSLPFDTEFPFIHLERKFMHLGFHIFDVGFQSPDSDVAQPMVFATTLLLILLVVVMNLAAIIIRNHLRKKYQASSF